MRASSEAPNLFAPLIKLTNSDARKLDTQIEARLTRTDTHT